MKRAICDLSSVSRYSQSAKIQSDKLERESSEDYEMRTWKERCHVTEDGHVFIPPMSFANSLKQAAKYLNIQIPGKGKSTFTKHFEAGVMVVEPLILPDKIEDIKGEMLYVPSDGVPGSGKRVDKMFPYIEKWSGTVEYVILDDTITEIVFKQVLVASGSLIGIGRFRPRNRGYYGRFKIDSMKWIDER